MWLFACALKYTYTQNLGAYDYRKVLFELAFVPLARLPLDLCDNKLPHGRGAHLFVSTLTGVRRPQARTTRPSAETPDLDDPESDNLGLD